MSLGARGKAAKSHSAGGKQVAEQAPAKLKQDAKHIKPQATTEQMRMALIIDRKNEDTLDVRRMVLELMEMTCRPEEEVCSALHDCDNDMARACDLLFEDSDRIQTEWQTTEKKKKPRPPPGGNGEADLPGDQSRPPRGRSGPRSRRDGSEGEFEGRGGRGARGGRGGRGAGRGGRGGGRGGRGGPRSNGGPPYHSRDRTSRSNAQTDNVPIEDWDAGITDNGPAFPVTEDWDNEEWSGSLADTKVFTPSTQVDPAIDPTLNNSSPIQEESWSRPGSALDNEVAPPSPAYLPPSPQHTHYAHNAMYHQDPSQQQMSMGKCEPTAAQQLTQALEMHQQVSQVHQVPQVPQQPQAAPMSMSGTLTAAQSHYLSQLQRQSQQQQLQQSQQQLQQPTALPLPEPVKETYATHGVYSSNYGVYSANDLSQQRKPQQRARVPPPSKIPASAVEMPGEAGAGAGTASIGFLDVQFGALEFDPSSYAPQPDNALHQDKYQTTSQPNVSLSEGNVDTVSGNLSSDVSRDQYAQQMLSESLSSVDTNQSMSVSQPQQHSPSHPTDTVLDNQLSSMQQQQQQQQQHQQQQQKHTSTSVTPVSAPSPAADTYAPNYQPQPQPYQTASKHQSHPPPQSMYAPTVQHHHVYGANVYAQQVNSSGAGLSGASALASGYPPAGLSQYHAQPLNSYQTSSSTSGYGANALYTAAPYNPYQAATTKMTAKENTQYENPVATQSLSTGSSTQTSTVKVTTSSGKVSSGASQAAYVQPQPAFYTQQQQAGSAQAQAAAVYAAYAAEEAQMMRGSIPHHMGTYYDVSAAAAAAAAGYGSAGREASFSAQLAAAAAAASAGAGGEVGTARFARGESSPPQAAPPAPAPPAPGLPPGYAYFFSGQMMPGAPHPSAPTTYQYGTPPIYPYGGAAASASSAGKGAPSAQPTYEQTQDTYKQGGYSSSGAGKSGSTNAADISNAMYANKHVTLNKVNSYEKAAFHSATPPPFGVGGVGGVGGVSAGGAASQHHQQMYIAAPHHHMHPAQHQMDVRVNSSHRRDVGGRGGAGTAKPGAKQQQAYSQSYWTPN